MNFFNLFQSKSTQLKLFLEQNPTLLDVRNPSELKDNAIPKAVNIPLDELYPNLSNLDKNAAYVLFCRSGNRSRNALELMQKNGFKKVFDAGSIEELRKALS